MLNARRHTSKRIYFSVYPKGRWVPAASKAGAVRQQSRSSYSHGGSRGGLMISASCGSALRDEAPSRCRNEFSSSMAPPTDSRFVAQDLTRREHQQNEHKGDPEDCTDETVCSTSAALDETEDDSETLLGTSGDESVSVAKRFGKDCARRHAEITSELARPWTTPERVRSLKQELYELQVALPNNLGSEADLVRADSVGPTPHPKVGRMLVDRLSWPPVAVGAQDQPVAAPQPVVPPAKGKPQPPLGGKGKAPASPPPPKALPSAKAGCGSSVVHTPPSFAWRLHSRALPDEQLADTAFSRVDAVALVDDKVEEKETMLSLQALFMATVSRVPVSIVGGRALPPPRKEVKLLSQVRAQSILIALQRQPVTSECLQVLIDLRFQVDALECCGLSADSCEVLLCVAPTPEEIEQLLDCAGDFNDLRDAERAVLPLARLHRPSAERRLQLAMFSLKLHDFAGRLHTDLAAVTDALATVRAGSMFRTVSRRALRLSNVLKHGNNGGLAAGGFAVADGLPKLSLCRAVSNCRATLLLVLVAHLVAWDSATPGRLTEDVAAFLVLARLFLLRPGLWHGWQKMLPPSVVKLRR